MTTRLSIPGLLDSVAMDWNDAKTFIEHMKGLATMRCTSW